MVATIHLTMVMVVEMEKRFGMMMCIQTKIMLTCTTIATIMKISTQRVEMEILKMMLRVKVMVRIAGSEPVAVSP